MSEAATKWLEGRPDRGKPVFLWIHVPELPEPGAEESAFSDVVAAFRRGGAKVVLTALGDATAGGDDSPVPTRVPEWAAAGEGRCLAALAADLAPSGTTLPGSVKPYWESVAPWYALRLPPLGSAEAAEGLRALPSAVPLGHQSEMKILAARGHLGEGLVPPLPPDVFPVDALDDAPLSRVAAWRAAIAAPRGPERTEALRQLSEASPDVPLFHETLGDELALAKDWIAACNAYAAAAQQGWNMVRANRMQSRCHAAIGNVPAAIDRAEAAFLADQSDPVPRRELAVLLLRTGSALLASGDLAEARACLDRSLLLAPDHPGAVVERARLDLAAGATNAAVAALRQELRRNPRDELAKRLLQSL